MPKLFDKKQNTENLQPSKKRMPWYLWAFYLGLLSLGMSSLTFSRYSTTVTGTISAQVADSYVLTFMDADGTTELAATRVYEGQPVSGEPDMYGSEAMLFSDNLNMDVGDFIYSDEDTVYRVFEGWSLDGENIIDLDTLVVDRDMVLIAVYRISPEPVETASPSNASPSDATPSDATPSDAVPLDGKPSDGVKKAAKLASPSNAS